MKNTVLYFYAIFLVLFTIFSYAFVDPNLIYMKNIYSGFAFENRSIVAILYILFVSSFFVFYGFFIWLGIKKQLKLKDIFVLVSITIASLVFSYPAMLSYDIFNYITTSKVLFFYHENPYIIMPIEFVGEPFLSFTHAANKIALYAPFWITLTGIPYVLGLGNFIVTLFSFKIFITLFYIVTTILVWKISKNIISVILFSLNPLIVIETLISGHNDIVMIFFVLLSFFILMKKKVGWAVVFFILSMLIKYTTLLLIPVFFFVIWKILRKREISWNNIFYFSALLMCAGFFLSPLREEIYPWYEIWFLSFAFLVPNRKILLSTSLVLSFTLLLRYIPFMSLGTHTGITPVIKSVVTFVPISLILFYFAANKLWRKIYYR